MRIKIRTENSSNLFSFLSIFYRKDNTKTRPQKQGKRQKIVELQDEDESSGDDKHQEKVEHREYGKHQEVIEHIDKLEYREEGKHHEYRKNQNRIKSVLGRIPLLSRLFLSH